MPNGSADARPEKSTAHPDPAVAAGTERRGRASWWERNPIAANGVVAVVVALIGVVGTVLVSGGGPGGAPRSPGRPPIGPPPPGGPPEGPPGRPLVRIDQPEGAPLTRPGRHRGYEAATGRGRVPTVAERLGRRTRRGGARLDLTGTVGGLPPGYALWAVAEDREKGRYFVAPDPCRVRNDGTWRCTEVPRGLDGPTGQAYVLHVALVDAYGAYAIGEDTAAAGTGGDDGLTQLPQHVALLEQVTLRHT